MNAPLVSTDWLAARLGDPAIQVVDATWFMPGDARSGRVEHETGHIPGAIFFDIDEIADQQTDLPHMLPSAEAFARKAGDLGLLREATVVVYDGHGIFSAPRAWWSLRAMGFPQVLVLDGGLPRWRAEGRPLESGVVRSEPVQLDPVFDKALVRDLAEVQRHIRERDAQLLDARPALRFRGDAPEPRQGLRAGHMPGARNVPWSDLIEPDGRMKPREDLRAVFSTVDLDFDAPIVATCGSGVSAALLALALARLGRTDVAVYDGSWAEWGARSDTAVVAP